MSGSPAVVIVGPPGSGKSTVGRAVAEQLGLGFRDTDADVEAASGKSIPDIFVQDGEEAFRAREREAVADAVAEHPGVLSLGGGAVIDPATREVLRSCTVVYLRVGLAEGLKRVGMAASRPVLALNPRAQYRSLLERRSPLYEEVASVTVDTDGRTLDEVVAVVVAHLAEGEDA
jgi:shikimate kinase